MLGRLRSEIKTIKEKDPAARSTLEIFLCYPGFYARSTVSLQLNCVWLPSTVMRPMTGTVPSFFTT